MVATFGLGSLPYSGPSGQSDFVWAANRSKGGRAFSVLPSSARGDSISRIVPVLSLGTPVSTSKNDMNYGVTEYGVAHCAASRPSSGRRR